MFLQKPQQQNIVDYLRNVCRASDADKHDREPMERIDREYFRTNNIYDADQQEKREQNRRPGKKVLEDITVPVIFPQVETAAAYFAGVFLTGYPIFATVASPENAIAGDMLDALNSDHQIKGRWVPNLSKAFRDGLKYNKMGVEVSWEMRKGLGLQTTQEGIQAKPLLWAGNSIRHIDMYNAIYDRRVPLNEVHISGEFGGYTEIMSRVKFKMFLENLPEEHRQKNTTEALECSDSHTSHYVPEVTDKETEDPRNTTFIPSQWLGVDAKGKRIAYRDIYEITTLYCRIIPEEHGIRVPQAGTPQIWKFIKVNGTVLVYAEKLTNAHNFLPTVFGNVYDDGLGNQTLSFAEHLVENQNMASALWNIKLASARRNVSDRGIYNPEFIDEANINSSNPSAKIPLRRGKFLDNLQKAYYPIPYDPTAANAAIQDAAQVLEFGRSISGITRPAEGQFLKGNRTLGEYQDIRGNADARLQILALGIQSQFIDPIKEIIKYNCIQFAEPGSIYFSVKKKRVDINPQILQDVSLDFKISDGLLPSSKIADSDFMQQFLQLVGTSPEVQQQFDIVALISYLASLRNVPNLEAFRRVPPNVPPNAAQPAAGAESGQSQSPAPAA